jgi:TRAP-type C4-dicarboxylate transport system permease small subunit
MSDDDRAVSAKKPSTQPAGAQWAEPLARLSEKWQGLEAWLCGAVLVVEVLSLTLWITLKGLATDYHPGENAAGLLTRTLLSMVILGGAAHLALRARGGSLHRNAVLAGVTIGFLVGGRLWAHMGVSWASNLLNCLQNASVLMLVGGLRGVATRLTLWLALLGASIATSRGKHIHVDVLIRYVPEKLRAPMSVIGLAAASVVSAVAVFGFVDYIGIAEFRVPAMSACPGDATKECDTPTDEKMSLVVRGMKADLFLIGRQASLDVRSFPRVMIGVPYDKWMKAAEWNEWLDSADWTAHFDKAAVDALHMDPTDATATRSPQVVVPGTGEEARGLLIRDANMVFPFGLAMIALKFLLRIVLVLTGHEQVHVEGEVGDSDLSNAEERDEQAQRAA